jgi:hypothetical protein
MLYIASKIVDDGEMHALLARTVKQTSLAPKIEKTVKVSIQTDTPITEHEVERVWKNACIFEYKTECANVKLFKTKTLH